MKNKFWYEFSFKISKEKDIDLVSIYLSEKSGNGTVTDNLSVDAFSQAEIVEESFSLLKAYFNEDINLEETKKELSSYLESNGITTEILITKVLTEDWANSWRENFKPIELSKIVVLPTWEKLDVKDKINIYIDPGMAFGTGGHETTKLCLQYIEEIVGEVEVKNMLDLGTGSGILAIACAKLGVKDILAVDIDEEAVEVASKNIELNGVNVVSAITPVEEINNKYDLIVANILAEELVRLKKEILNVLSDSGVLILSFILSEKYEFVVTEFQKMGKKVISDKSEGEWVAIRIGN